MSKQLILVAGASGYVGGHLVPRLLDSGYRVRCLARNPDKLSGRNWQNVEIVQGDVLNKESLGFAMQDVDVAYYLVHAMGSEGDFESRDIQSARNFGTAAANSYVKRILYLGGLGEESPTLSSHLKSRQLVGKVLAESGVPVTELRASIIIGAGSASFEIIRDLVKKLPVMTTPKWVQSKAEPISIQSVIDYLLGCLEEPRTIGQVLEIGGVEVMQYGEMMRQVAEVMGKKLFMIRVPVLTPHLSAYWLNLVTSVPMSIAFPLVEGLKNDTVCHDFRIREWIPINQPTFKEAVQNALNIQKTTIIQSRWTEAGGNQNKVINLESIFILKNEQFIKSAATQEQLFNTIQRIGGDNGWYYANWTWKLRGAFDRLIGGVGMRRGRRHPIKLRVGDAVDFWRVEKFIPNQHLRLKAEMKLPGNAWLDFSVNKSPEGFATLSQIAIFAPKGWFGRLYWYSLVSIHFFIFRNMAKRIVKRAENDIMTN